jgi:sugar/nucleoside kinase (ribokinase family)
VTPQGWLRTWDEAGHIRACEWPEAGFILQNSAVGVISLDDVSNDENRIEELASASKILVVTEEAAGVRVYWNGDVRRFRAPQVEMVDPTGAGDIFAVFHRHHL